MNLLSRPARFVLSILGCLGLAKPRALNLEPDTDLERYLFCRDLRASSGQPRR